MGNVKKQAEDEGLDKIFIEAGCEWREPGCSMCLAMNPDKLVGDQLCASSSNRNFKGRQGHPQGRTVLASPAMAAAAVAKKLLRQLHGVEVTGWFTEDFTLAELKTLRAQQLGLGLFAIDRLHYLFDEVVIGAAESPRLPTI